MKSGGGLKARTHQADIQGKEKKKLQQRRVCQSGLSSAAVEEITLCCCVAEFTVWFKML